MQHDVLHCVRDTRGLRPPLSLAAEMLRLSRMADDNYSLRESARRGLAGRCPRCGKGALFQGFLKVAPRCENCGLDFAFADAADGPAFFVMSFAGFVVVAAALVVEVAYQPPYWLHALLWIPLILAMTLLPLRPAKGLLIALQYHHKAAEGRLIGGDRP
jgi:uncharacterized protein (DUF983 family)